MSRPGSEGPAASIESIRTGSSSASIAAALLDNLQYGLARLPRHATRNDWYTALAHAVRDRMLDRLIAAIETLSDRTDVKVVAYLSAEFLMGPHLGNALVNLGLTEAAREAVASVGQDLEDLLDQEEEPGLGNGGLGRLAACYMDSLATLRVPAVGYGIRYEFGIFDQEIRDGWQVELTDKWLRFGNPWEIVRSDLAYPVMLGGRTEHARDESGRLRVKWVPDRMVRGIAYDTPVPGYLVDSTNLLRLWKAEAIETFDLGAFNKGDYYGAVNDKVESETISKVLYPNDEPAIGKRLRLAQQYFFVSCSLQDMIRIHLVRGLPLERLSSSWAAQMNDTHPTIAVAELMRLLIDEHELEWDVAWRITQETCAYTNHTLLAEALETWRLPMFAKLLPRHLEIIYEINRRFLDEVRREFPDDDELVSRLSIIGEQGDKQIRMAHLACVGSHAINGVAALHTELLKETVLGDFYRISPQKFFNVTNGVTPRRWILVSNPPLAALITRSIGDRWIADLEHQLDRLEPFANDTAFQAEWQSIQTANKRTLARLVQDKTGITLDSSSLFDVQVKRFHEYKRQHLNVLYLVTMYCRLKRDPDAAKMARTVIFGGKAAPGYRMAKLIIRLINGVASVVNADPQVSERLKVVFFPNFNVQSGQQIYPAADLSEQISLAGKEASGTGNMKFAMNGALTIGTLDGANVEIREVVGHENFFLFGMNAGQVAERRQAGYEPRRIYESHDELRETIDLVAGGAFSNGDRELFRPLIDSLLDRDEYMLLADYDAYVDCQERVADAWADESRWTRMSILNAARVGRFSSDRAVREYCRDIWNVKPIA